MAYFSMKKVLPIQEVAMPTNTIKVAISIPKKDFKLLEAIRKRMKISRSALIDRALHYWLTKKEEEKMVRQYIDGYKRHPETPEELKELAAMEKMQAETMEKEDWS